jgi:hypothetical protein
MTSFTLKSLQPRLPDGLTHHLSYVEENQCKEYFILVVSFEGKYPDGSRGNGHGQHIAAATMFANSLYQPDAIILDLRGLHYRWGNTLMRVFQETRWQEADDDEEEDQNFPVHVVTSDLCRDAILSLMHFDDGFKERHHDDMYLAIAAAIQHIDRRYGD